MNVNYFLHMWRRNWIKVLAVISGCLLWGFLAPVIDKSVISTLQRALPPGFRSFGSGDAQHVSGRDHPDVRTPLPLPSDGEATTRTYGDMVRYLDHIGAIANMDGPGRDSPFTNRRNSN
jgi:hypothetical protein